MRFAIVGASVLALVVACGGQTSPSPGPGGSSSSGGSGSSGSGSSSGGGSGSSSGASVGCPNDFTTTPSVVNPHVCMPQLATTTSCMGSPCSWTVEVPCMGTGQPPPDAGTTNPPCMAWCAAAAPPGAPSSGFCTTEVVDGGPAVIASCGGCGV
jgi:hypothetical protein